MDVNGYELIIKENKFYSFSNKLEIDLKNRKLILSIGNKIDSIAKNLKSYYSFVVKPPYPTYIGQEPQKSINFEQSWAEVHLEHSGDALIMERNEPFEYFPLNPAYMETFYVSGGGASWKKSSTGVIMASQIRDRIKQARREQ